MGWKENHKLKMATDPEYRERYKALRRNAYWRDVERRRERQRRYNYTSKGLEVPEKEQYVLRGPREPEPIAPLPPYVRPKKEKEFRPPKPRGRPFGWCKPPIESLPLEEALALPEPPPPKSRSKRPKVLPFTPPGPADWSWGAEAWS